MIQWMDNFQSYGTTAAFMLNGLYAQLTNVSLVDDPDPLVAETVLRMDVTNDAGTCRFVLGNDNAVVGAAFRIWPDSMPTDSSRGFQLAFQDEDAVIHCYLRMITTGELQFLNGDGTALADSDGPVIISNAWQHVEIKVGISAAAGTVEVRVEGVTVIDASGLDTANSAKLTVAQTSFRNFFGNSGAVSYQIRDFVLWDDQGTENTDFLGAVTVYRLTPNADRTLGGWTTSSGVTGFDLIDESPPVDVGYIQADDAPPAACEFDLSDLPPDITSVKGVMSLVRMQKTDGGDATVQVSVESDGSYDLGADRPITTAFTYWYDVSEEDPSTAAPWTRAAVDAAGLRINRTT